MSRPMCVVYEVRSKSCSSPPNTISTCSTELRSPSRRLSTRLRTSRLPSWASAHRSSAPSPMRATRCWIATVSGPSSWRPARVRFEPAPRLDLGRPGEQRLATGDGRTGRDELLDDRRRCAVAKLDDGAGQERAVRRTDDPAQDDRMLDDRTPAGMRRTTPWFQPARVSWASWSSAGSEASSARSSSARSGSRSMSARRCRQVDAGPLAAADQRDAAGSVLLESRRTSAPSGAAEPRSAAARRPASYRADVPSVAARRSM